MVFVVLNIVPSIFVLSLLTLYIRVAIYLGDFPDTYFDEATALPDPTHVSITKYLYFISNYTCLILILALPFFKFLKLKRQNIVVSVANILILVVFVFLNPYGLTTWLLG